MTAVIEVDTVDNLNSAAGFLAQAVDQQEGMERHAARHEPRFPRHGRSELPRFEYHNVAIRDLIAKTHTNDAGKEVIDNIIIHDEPYVPTPRFWNSLFANFQFNRAFFKYYSYDEVFQRLSERCKTNKDQLRVCVEMDRVDTSGEDGCVQEQNFLLAASGQNRPVLTPDTFLETIARHRGGSVSYGNGVMEAMFEPRIPLGNFEINGDSFSHKFVLHAPVDGYGLPKFYVMLMRQVCSNGAIGFAPAFESSIKVGKKDGNIDFVLNRALEGFNNEEGYSGMQSRFESAVTSHASIRELMNLEKQLLWLYYNHLYQLPGADGRVRPVGGDGASTPNPRRYDVISEQETACTDIRRALDAVAGDPCRTYGLVNLDALSNKRQRALPVKARVYDLLNFASEVATHKALPDGSRMLQSWLGNLISKEYDLEGSADGKIDFADFLTGRKLEEGLTGTREVVATQSDN